MLKVVSAFGFGEQVEGLAAEAPEFFRSSLGAIAKHFYELEEDQLDRVEIG